MTAASPAKTVYFGYGSNLWLHQMSQRCPKSQYLGVARLNNYRWNISPRGYANVVESGEQADRAVSSQVFDKYQDARSQHSHNLQQPFDQDTSYSAENFVYGLVFSLTPEDEAQLDRNEGVPVAYTKEYLSTEFWAMPEDATEPQWTDVTQEPKNKTMLVYIDRERTDDSKPKTEYIFRMNMGIKDAIAMGVPEDYVETVIRKFIPQVNKSKVEKLARKQALDFEDER